LAIWITIGAAAFIEMPRTYHRRWQPEIMKELIAVYLRI